MSVAGDRQFDPWAVTIINDNNFTLRGAFERWMNGINQHKTNTGLMDPMSYLADLSVEQLDKTGLTVKRYDIRGCWPTNLSAIDLSYDAANTIEEFGVEFQMTWWESNTTT